MNKYNAQIGAGGTQYAYYHEEDESSFQLVSTRKIKKAIKRVFRCYLTVLMTQPIKKIARKVFLSVLNLKKLSKVFPSIVVTYIYFHIG